MGRHRFGARLFGWLLLLLLLLRLPRSAAQKRRSGTCLVNATYAPGERWNVTVGGVSQPLSVGQLSWVSGRILHWMFRIITEEVVGVNTVSAGPYSSSIKGWQALVQLAEQTPGPTPPQQSGPHVLLGAWMSNYLVDLIEAKGAAQPELLPVNLGSMGYTAYDGVFVKTTSYEPAMRQEWLALDFYMSYSHPAFDPRRYFDSLWAIDAARLQFCNETRIAATGALLDYVRLFNDSSGVALVQGPLGATLVANCGEEGKWWLAPACRADPSRCVPVITGGDGWDADDIMHRATAWRMPIAVAVAKDWASYLELPKRHRLLFYWWVPDNSFAMADLRKIIWPVHDSRQHSLGLRSTETPPTTVAKLVSANLEGKNSSGLSKPLAVLHRMTIRRFEIMDLVKLVAERQGSTDALELVACEWLNNHTERYTAWIPLPTACEAQRGLVNQSGAFVATREEAHGCEWCAPGRMSAPVRDSEGATYRCEACGVGTFQASLGATSCERCEEGTFAADRGQHSCRHCRFGEFAARPGQSTCDACPPGLITSFLGATSAEACICPEGSYRDGDRRSLCLPCKEGMACPAGSDMLGYHAQHAARHPVVPLLQPGFWSSRDAPLSVFRCADDVRCPEGRAPGSPCAENFELQSCGACRAGHVRAGGRCVPCAAPATRALLFPVLPCGLLALAVCIIYRFDGTPYAKWGSWTKGAASSFFILLNHYHVIHVIHTLNATPKRSVSDTLEAVSALSDLLSVFRPQCSGFGSFMSQLVLKSHGPAFIFLFYAAIFGVFWLIGVRFPQARMEPDRLLNGYCSMIFTFFTSVAEMAFTIFKCSDNPNGLWTLTQDRSITCYTGAWRGMLAVGASAVLFCVGFGVLLLRVIYVASQRFHSPRFQTRWTFLFVRYRPDVHWWALIIVAKGVLLNVGPLFIASGVGQVYWVLLVLLLYAGLLLTFWPWRHVINNFVDCYMSCSLVLTCAITAWFSHSAGPDIEQQEALGGGMLQANTASMGAAFVVAVAAMWWRGASGAARRKKEVDVQLIMHAVDLVDLDQEVQQDFKDLLEDLTEHDFALMSRAKDVIVAELGDRGVPELARRSTRPTSSEQPDGAHEAASGALSGARPLESCQRRADPAAREWEDDVQGGRRSLISFSGVRRAVL